jgi:transketolase
MDSMRDRFATVTSTLLDEDSRLALVLAVISADRFTGAARTHPDRVIDVGIREQLLVSVAGGLALTGIRPIVHTFASFLIERPFEQIKLDLCHQGVGAVLVSSGASYDVASAGRTHQAPGDVALLNTLEGWTVHVPGHPDEVETLLRHAVADRDDRVYIRLSEQVNLAALPVTPGKFLTVLQGDGPVVIAVGPMLDAVIEATTGLDPTVLYAATIRPFDATSLRVALGAGQEVVLVEPYQAGTSVPFVNEALQDRPLRVLGLGTDRTELRRYGSWHEHVAAHGLDARGVRERITAFTAG